MNKYSKGSLLLSIMNDLKRNDEVAAIELGVPKEQLQSWIRGESDIPDELLCKAAEIWPINRRDFEPIPDDIPEGLLVMTAEESQSTERVLHRKNMPYYAYRDTAMSRMAPFRPEWIEELVDVDNSDVDDKRVCWNNGHFLHQFTYFIGPVNFYFMRNNKKCLVEMNTGDSMYISPYVPHTFTNRIDGSKQRGLIMALTYSGDLGGDARAEMGALGNEVVNKMVIPSVFSYHGSRCLLKFRMLDACIDANELSLRCGISLEKTNNFLQGNSAIHFDELHLFAQALHIDVKDLLVHDAQESEDVELLSRKDCCEWVYNDYRVKQLASSKAMPKVKAFELLIDPELSGGFISTSLFQYGYILGPSSVDIFWVYNGTNFRRTLNPGDSFVMKPSVEHRFESSKISKILLLRVPGKVSGDALLELSSLPSEGIGRAIHENKQWYQS